MNGIIPPMISDERIRLYGKIKTAIMHDTGVINNIRI